MEVNRFRNTNPITIKSKATKKSKQRRQQKIRNLSISKIIKNSKQKYQSEKHNPQKNINDFTQLINKGNKVSIKDVIKKKDEPVKYERSTAPCIQNITRSISNQNRSLKQKSKQKNKKSLKQNLSKVRAKNKISLKVLKDTNLNNKNTGLKREIKIQDYNQRKLPQKVKSLEKKKNQQKIPFTKYQFKQYPKTTCITRSISKNNSKEKDNTPHYMNKKFKKQIKPKDQGNLKKNKVYSSIKISQRNSTKFLITSNNQYIAFDTHIISRKPSVMEINCNSKNLIKLKSLKFINQYQQNTQLQTGKNTKQLAKNLIGNSIDKPIDNKIKQNIAGELRIVKKQHCFEQIQAAIDNIHQTSLSLYFQNSNQVSFQMQCESSLRQRLTRLQLLSLQNSKQQYEQIQTMNSFQDLFLKDSHSYSIADDIINIIKNKSYNRQCKVDWMHRVQVVDYLSMIANTLLLKTDTFHLATTYFDIYTNKHCQQIKQTNHQTQYYTYNHQQSKQNNESLKLVSLGCLLLAVKMDQRQYQHEIIDTLINLNNQFNRTQLISIQQQIFRSFKSKLKIQTIPFWLDYFSFQWDFFISSPQLIDQILFLRQISGVAYENYRKTTQIINAVLIDAGNFVHQFVDISLSTIFIVLEQLIQKSQKQTILQQINSFKQNANTLQNQQKLTLSTFETQKTLDEMQKTRIFQENSKIQKNQKQNMKINDIRQQDTLFRTKIDQKLGRSSNSRKKLRQLSLISSQEKLNKFKITFQAFLKRYVNKNFENIQKTISYIRQLLELKQNLEVDPRIYEQSISYEQFIRFHCYSPFIKPYLIRKHRQNQQNSKSIKKDINNSSKSHGLGGKILYQQSQTAHKIIDNKETNIIKLKVKKEQINTNHFICAQIDNISSIYEFVSSTNQ